MISNFDFDDVELQDICRVCRSEGTRDRPLFHPCICTGSIKYIHQECLVEWLRYSRKEYCELCSHRFSFTPIYSPDMPKRLPLKDVLSGLLTSIGLAVRYWMQYTLVGCAWLIVVPLLACRIYRCLFTVSVSSIFTLDMLSTENILYDIFNGYLVVTCTLFAFISLVWLREQILHGGGPEWLELEVANVEPLVVNQAEPREGDIQPGDPQVQDADVQNNVDHPEIRNVNNDGVQEDNNWNPMEWDRGGEELTWERLLGLDGSLVFMEHVCWVVALNTFFILVFAFCPYHIGHFVVLNFNLKKYIEACNFEGLIITLWGYCISGTFLVIFHMLASKLKRIVGLCYIVVKVCLLSVLEIGLIPLVSGWWIDICSLQLFGATLKDRQTAFKQAPAASMFLHWLVGMLYVFYYANFILLLREVLRPGVLWFLRNLNDPDFNPVLEMIHIPLIWHVQRVLISAIIFGSSILFLLLFPATIIGTLLPNFLPYVVTVYGDPPISSSLEILLLQVVLPTLLEQGSIREWIKNLVWLWCHCVSWLLDISSYLLGNSVSPHQDQKLGNSSNQLNGRPLPPPPIPPLPAANGLGAAHQALLQRDRVLGFQPYCRPKWFHLKIVLLMVLVCLSVTIISILCLTIPVAIGRPIMQLSLGQTRVHELYTCACGMYICWIVIRSLILLTALMPLKWAAMSTRIYHWMITGMKAAIILSVFVVIVPLMLGVLVDQVILIPLRVPLTQTPLIYLWQDWIMGVLYTKIACGLTMAGPNWWLRHTMEQVYEGGVHNLQLEIFLKNLALPVLIYLGLALTIPYVLIRNVATLLTSNSSLLWLIERRMYPFLLMMVLIVMQISFCLHHFLRLYEHIKNERYLVGRQLVNYEPHYSASRITN